jgi:hypothetical protein
VSPKLYMLQLYMHFCARSGGRGAVGSVLIMAMRAPRLARAVSICLSSGANHAASTTLACELCQSNVLTALQVCQPGCRLAARAFPTSDARPAGPARQIGSLRATACQNLKKAP